MHDLDWFDEYERSARLAGDLERSRLGAYHREAYRFRESDPDHALELLAEGRRAAERLREPWWVLYYDQQRVHALLHFKQDYRDVLDLAVRNTLEVRKPAYAGFPRLFMVHGDLVSAYLGIDATGYAEPIRQALDYLDEVVPPDSDERYLLLGSRRQFALEREEFAEAERWTQESLALAAGDPDRGRACHFLVFAHSGLAEIAYRQEDWEGLEQFAGAGELLAETVGHQVERAGFWMWQALICRRQGREERAARLHRTAAARLGRLGMIPDYSYRDAECAFHELAGDLRASLAVRDHEWAAIRDRGRLAYEATVLVKRGWLRHRLGLLTPADLDEMRAAAGRLRQPDHVLGQIGRLARGEAP